jgi:hypothetical protein
MLAAISLARIGRSLTAAFLVVAALGVLGCSLEEKDATHRDGERVAILDSGIVVPPSATNIRVYEASFLDAVQLIRFDAPLAEAREFARTLLKGNIAPRQIERSFFYASSSRDWWIRDAPPEFEGGRWEASGRRIQLLLVPQGEKATIWLEAWAF